MENSSGRWLLARDFALWGGAVNLLIAGSGIRELPVESATMGERLFASFVGGALLVVGPLIVAGLLIWWALRGWRLDPQPRWMTSIRWGFAVGAAVGWVRTR